MERTLKKAIRTASNVNSLMLLLFYGLIYAAVFGIQLLIPHLLPEDSTYYEAISSALCSMLSLYPCYYSCFGRFWAEKSAGT